MGQEKDRQAYRKSFAKRLDLLRQQAGYSKKELGEISGIAQNTISQYTLGLVEPTIYSLSKLCQALGCTADELINPDYYRFESFDPLDSYEFVSEDLMVLVYSKSGLKPAIIFFNESDALAIEGQARFTKLKRV